VLSPVQIDHLVNAYLGWLGMQAVATADLAVRPVMDLPEPPERRINELFTIGDFAKTLPDYQSKYVTRLYDQGQKFQQALNDMRFYMTSS